MKVGIYGRIFFKPGSGIVRYSFELMESLAKYHPENEYVIYINKNSKPIPKFGKNVKIRKVNLPYALWRTALFTRIMDKDKIDVYHSMSYTLPLVPSFCRKVKIVSTFHGLHSEYLKHQTGRFISDLVETVYWVLNYRTASYFADRIISVSDTLANEINKLYHKPRKYIDTTYFGTDEKLKPISDGKKEEVKRYLSKKYGLPSKYITYIGGGMAKNKNLDTIVKAWGLLKRKGLKAPLVATRISTKQIAQLLEELDLKEGKDVIGLEWIDGKDLPSLYACAVMDVYPSLYEGLGFPIIEAMKCGTPVITSNVSAMPEAAGGAALLVKNPKNEKEWAEKIFLLYNDKELQERLRNLGIKRAGRFTWRRVANDTIDSYKKCIT